MKVLSLQKKGHKSKYSPYYFYLTGVIFLCIINVYVYPERIFQSYMFVTKCCKFVESVQVHLNFRYNICAKFDLNQCSSRRSCTNFDWIERQNNGRTIPNIPWSSLMLFTHTLCEVHVCSSILHVVIYTYPLWSTRVQLYTACCYLHIPSVKYTCAARYCMLLFTHTLCEVHVCSSILCVVLIGVVILQSIYWLKSKDISQLNDSPICNHY